MNGWYAYKDLAMHLYRRQVKRAPILSLSFSVPNEKE